MIIVHFDLVPIVPGDPNVALAVQLMQSISRNLLKILFLNCGLPTLNQPKK